MFGSFRLATGIWLLTLVLAPAWVSAETSTGLDRLQDFQSRVQTLRADFRQQVIDGNGMVVESASGRLLLKRPGKFRWNYAAPFERVVLADGKELWLYEADLEQVTVRKLAEGLGETPAALLTGQGDILDRFEYLNSWSGEDIQWVRLRPKAAESDFDSIAIGFAGDKPVQMELNDRLGQQTRVYLSAIRMNESISDAEFRFVVPPGVDVIRESEL